MILSLRCFKTNPSTPAKFWTINFKLWTENSHSLPFKYCDDTCILHAGNDRKAHFDVTADLPLSGIGHKVLPA